MCSAKNNISLFISLNEILFINLRFNVNNMEGKKSNVGAKKKPEGEKKVQSYYYVKKKNKARVAEEVKRLVAVMDR
jgi:hypothetical protein